MEKLSKSELYKMKQQIEKMLLSDQTEDDLEINVFIKKKRELEHNNWLFLFQDTEFLLAKTLTPSACKIIMLFRAVCKYENRVEYSVNQISKLLSVTRQTTSKGIKELKDKGIVIEFKDKIDERKSIYYINPESQWKGKIVNQTPYKAIFDADGRFSNLKTELNPNQLDLLDFIKESEE